MKSKNMEGIVATYFFKGLEIRHKKTEAFDFS